MLYWSFRSGVKTSFLADNQSNSDLQRWRCRPRSASTAPLSPPSSPSPPRWPEKPSAPSDRSAGRCVSVSAGRWGDSHWRWICSGCRSGRWWCRSSPRRCPAPEPTCTQEDLRTVFMSEGDSGYFFSHGWSSSSVLCIPAGEDLPVIQSPLCQVESGLPGHQAGGPVWDQSYVFQQADRITTTGLQDGDQHQNINVRRDGIQLRRAVLIF